MIQAQALIPKSTQASVLLQALKKTSMVIQFSVLSWVLKYIYIHTHTHYIWCLESLIKTYWACFALKATDTSGVFDATLSYGK